MEGEKKRLLLIATSLRQGGFQRVCARTAVLLNQYFKVSVAIFDGRDIAYLLDDIPVYNLQLEAKPGAFAKAVNVFRRIDKLKRLKKEHQIDISYSFGMSANLVNILAKTGDIIWTGIRSYVDLNTKSIGAVCRHSDTVICCSRALEYQLKERYGVRSITTIYNPFDIEELIRESHEEITDKEFFEKKGPLIAAMGREDTLKGYWHLIKSFAALENTDARLCIIGNGTFEKEKELANKLNIQERIYFTGGKINPFSYLRYANLYVMSSVHEGFPNALVEAMALGVPVISTNCETGPGEILTSEYKQYQDIQNMKQTEYGILVPKLNEKPNYHSNHIEPEEMILSEAMDLLLRDNQLRERYAQVSVLRAACFGTKEYIDQFLKLIG